MENKIADIKERLKKELADIKTSKLLYELKVKYVIGKTGEIPSLMKELGKASKEDRPKLGQIINGLKDWATEAIAERERAIAEMEKKARYEAETIDITKPSKRVKTGTLHPVTIVKNQLVDIFAGMGFSVVETREIEDDFHNFTALNTPAEHPARDKQDTFYINENVLLRTQTSSVQIRVMEQTKPPIRIISPGRVYRSDAVDATHSPLFHQIEGLVIDKGITMADLKGTLELLMQRIYGDEAKVRFRPHHFPYTEPSAEVDLMCFNCHGKGCSMCKQEGWVELLGSGMVHPKVLADCGIDPEVYSGFAFGIGLERITMGRYSINDMRLLYENDMRFLEQF